MMTILVNSNLHEENTYRYGHYYDHSLQINSQNSTR